MYELIYTFWTLALFFYTNVERHYEQLFGQKVRQLATKSFPFV
jgi:hypothetical protein